MTFGAEFTNAAGVVRLAPDDFVDRSVATGTATFTYDSGTGTFGATVSVSGFSADGNWAVTTFGADCRVALQSGSFRIISPDLGSCEYAVYRRT